VSCDCAGLLRQLSDYLDDTLAAEARAAFEAHLAGCDKCHVVLDTTRSTILLCRIAESPSLPDERREALLRRLELACRRAP